MRSIASTRRRCRAASAIPTRKPARNRSSARRTANAVENSAEVPGGLLDFVKCNEIKNIVVKTACEAVFENGLTGVNAVTELVAPASSIYLNEFALQNELPYPPQRVRRRERGARVK